MLARGSDDPVNDGAEDDDQHKGNACKHPDEHVSAFIFNVGDVLVDSRERIWVMLIQVTHLRNDNIFVFHIDLADFCWLIRINEYDWHTICVDRPSPLATCVLGFIIVICLAGFRHNGNQ